MAENPEFPITLTKGGAKVTIYLIGSKVRPRYQVAYYIGDRRKLKNKLTLAEAKIFAGEQLSFAVSGRKAVAEMSEDDRNTFIAALAKLRPTGVGLMAAVSDFVAAYKVMGERGSLLMAAKDFVRRAEIADKSRTDDTGAVVEEFIESRRLEWVKDPLTCRDYETVRSHSRQFVKSFHCPIQQISKNDIVKWLTANTESKRTYNNKRTTLIRLFNFAKLQGYLSDELLSAAELVPRKKRCRCAMSLPCPRPLYAYCWIRL